MDRDQLIDSDMWVCLCCMLTHANGECCSDDEHGGDGRQPWAEVDFATHSVTMGLLAEEHDPDYCSEEIRDRDECDCERREFSTSRCDGCGSFLHGSRYAFALWLNCRTCARQAAATAQ